MDTAEEVEDKKKKEHRVLSVDKITVEKIVLESSCGSREVLLTKNESSRKLSIGTETISKEDAKPELGIKRPGRIKPIRLTKRPSIGSIVIARSGSKLKDVQEVDEVEKINAKNRLEKSRSTIEELQQNLTTKIDADTAERYKQKLLESREKALRPVESNDKGRVAFDEEFLQKHNLDKRLKIEEYEPTGDRRDEEANEEEPLLTGENARPSYSEKVSEVEKRWSGEFLKNQLDRRSSESSRSSYVEECSVSSRDSAEEYDNTEREDRKTEFGSHSAIDLSENRTSEENLADSTVSTVDSDSCLEDRIKSLDEDIEAREEPGTACEDEERREELAESEWKEESRDSRIDGYASLIKEFTMEAGCSRVKKEEKQKKKLGLRRLLPGFFSPKDSRKEYKKKEGKDRKRPDDRYFARYQQNGNYTRSPDTMNLNEDIKRNVKLDNSLNGSMIEERLDEIKRELFPEQGLITSTPDHLARDEDRNLARDQGHPRSYTTDSSLSSIAPDDRWNNERNLGISPDIRKFEQRQKREEFGQRYGQLERKHSLQEPRPYFFQRNHGPSGRISAPPSERYLVRPRAIHPIDRPLPAIPHSRTELIDYDENYLAEEDETTCEQIGYGRQQRYPSEPGFYENDPTSGLILKSVSAQVKITRQPIVNQNQRAPLVGRSPKYLSSGSSHKSGDYGDSSCTPNSSQKSEFSPTSSKSGEYYLHSPRNSASPNGKEGIYENEKSPSRSSTRCMDERIYDETPSSPCEKGSIEDALDRRASSPRRKPERPVSPRESAEKCEDPQRQEESAARSPSTGESRGKPISPTRQSVSRRSRPNEQILIASPKREPYETRIPRPTETRRCARESPVQITSAPREPVDSFGASGQNSPGNVATPKGQGSPAKIPRPEPVYGHRGGQLVPGSPTRANVQRKDSEDTVTWVQSSPQKNEPTNSQTRNPNPIASPRVPQQQQQQQIEALYTQRIGEPPTYGSRTASRSLSPSKQQTRQHLEAFYWQQKALEAHRKSLASPGNVGQRQMGRKIDLPEVREAVYWQQLKKLDEEQQRRIYEQNAMEETARCKVRAKNPARTPEARQQESVQNLSMPGDLRCPKGNPTGKPPLMQTQKGQNQPVLIVRPQQAIRDRREIPTKPVDAGRQEVQRSKSASPHFHRNDPQPRKMQVSSVYEDEKAPPPPIFKRGSLVGGEPPATVEYATGGGAKRVSFSNQSAAGGQELATGNWPTKHGTAPEPPTRRHRSEDSVSDTDSVFLHREPGTHCQDEYDADRPLPPLPKDPRTGRAVPCGDIRWNPPRPPAGAQRSQKEEEWNSDGKGRQSNDTGGSGRGESEAGSNEVRRGGSGGGGGGVSSIGSGGGSVLGVGGSGSGSVVGGSGGRTGSGGGGRSRDEPRRHTLGGDHQPSLHHQQFNAGQQLHPLHPHHLPPPHGQYGTPPTRHTTMDLEMGTKSRQRKSPLPRGYPPPSSTMLFDDDPGIMSEVETSSTGFRRGGKQRSSLPVVRTPSKTLERPLGLVFLQYRNETKRALLPNEITSIDTVKALFVRSFPKQLTMEYLDSPHVKVYIHDSNKDMFYELEDLRSHLRDIRDRSVLRLFESSDGVTGMPGPMGIPGSGLPPHWEDQSYFSEPEFDSEYQHQHIHKSKTAKNSNSNSGYYVGGSSTLPRGGQMMRAYSPAASSVVGGPTATPTQAKPLATPDRLHGESGYMSSPERGGGVGSGSGRYPPGPYSAGSSYEDPYYSQYSGTVTPVIDEEARIRVEHMERQLANLTGMLQKALTHAPYTSPSPRDYLQVPAGRDPYARGPDKSVSFEKSVSFSDEPPDMNSPKQHSPQHAERDRHKPTPPPKPAALVAGQYVYRDLALTPEMYNQLRGLQKKAKDLRQEVRHLRRMSQAQAHTIRETILDTFITIRTMLLSCGDAAWDAEKIRLTREEDLYRQEMLRLVKDLTELENTVEELRGNVINRKTRVNMSDVENMALIMSKSSKTVADLKVRFPSLQEGMKGLLSSEMEMVVRAEKFLKEEPERLESALKRCKKLTSTLVTLKRLASVQEQRLPNAATSVDAEETPPITPTSAQHSKAAAPVPAERTVVGSASVLGGGPHAHEPPAAHQQRPENALDALLDELQTFSRPSSQLGHAQGSSTMLSELGRSGTRGEAVGASSTVGRPPCISDIGRKGSVDSSSGPLPGTLAPSTAVLPSTQGGTLRRLHSYPSSSDTDTSPPIARLQVSLQEQPSLPTLPQGFVPGQKPPVPERNAELLQLASARRVPPPPPPRTSSRSPLASPTSPQLPPRNHSCALQGNATLRRPPARGALPVKEGKPPMALPADAVASEAGPVPHNNSTSSQSSAVLSTSNSSSCESVNSQEGLQSKKGRHEQLEQRHQELLRKQKALQEQYARLQQLQRNTAGLATVPPAPPDLLKKTGSESNLLAKMGLGLSAASSGSLTSLTQAKPGVSQESSVDGTRTRLEEPEQQQQQQQQQAANENSTTAVANVGESDGGQSVTTTTTTTTTSTATPASGTATTTTTSKIYETDIL